MLKKILIAVTPVIVVVGLLGWWIPVTILRSVTSPDYEQACQKMKLDCEKGIGRAVRTEVQKRMKERRVEIEGIFRPLQERLLNRHRGTEVAVGLYEVDYELPVLSLNTGAIKDKKVEIWVSEGTKNHPGSEDTYLDLPRLPTVGLILAGRKQASESVKELISWCSEKPFTCSIRVKAIIDVVPERDSTLWAGGFIQVNQVTDLQLRWRDYSASRRVVENVLHAVVNESPIDADYIDDQLTIELKRLEEAILAINQSFSDMTGG